MGLSRFRERGRTIITRGVRRQAMKPPPLMGRLAPPPEMLRPRGMPPVPHPGLLPRMRPPPPGMRSPRLLPPPPGPRRPPLPPFIPPPPPGGPHSFPPAIPRAPMPLLRPRPGQRPPPPPPLGRRPPLGVAPPMRPMGRLGRGGKRLGMPMKGKAKTKKTNPVELQENELNKPWVTEAMKNEIMKKHRFYQKAKKSNDENDWKEFKEQKTRVTTMLREAKLEYIGNHPEEEKDHYCETCDREFKSANKLAEHIQEHSTCGIDGCQFVAHPKIISKHVQMQHDTGLYKKINTLYTPEDVEKWIAERKRLYPTKENIARRQSEREEKMKRGERLGENATGFRRNSVSFNSRGKKSGYMRDNQPVKCSFQGKNHQFKKRREKSDFKTYPPLKSTNSSTKESCDVDKNVQWKILPFAGTGAYEQDEVSICESEKVEDKQKQFSDSEWEAESRPTTCVSTPNILVVSKALSGLMSLYASDATESEDDQECTSVSNVCNPVNESKTIPGNTAVVASGSHTSISDTPQITQECEDGSSGPEEAPILHENSNKNDNPGAVSETDSHETSNCRKRKRRHKSNISVSKSSCSAVKDNDRKFHDSREKNPQKYICKRRRKLTLLEKLLFREINHERNVILQCVRFTVKNNFFNSGNLVNTEKLARISNCLLQCVQYVTANKFFDFNQNGLDDNLKKEQEVEFELQNMK